MNKPVLYDYYRSSASYRVRIALNLKGVDYERGAGRTCSKASRRRAPIARAIRRASCRCWRRTAQRLTQSLAIIDWLDARLSRAAACSRADADDRAHVLALALTIACDIHPLNNLRVLKYLAGLGSTRQDARRLVPPLDRAKASPRSRRWPRRAPAASCSATRRRSPTSAWCRRCTMRAASRCRSTPYPTLVRADAEANRARSLRRRASRQGRAGRRERLKGSRSESGES